MPNQTLPPKEWGAHFWYFMSVVADGIDLSDQEDVATRVRFFNDLRILLPCPQCRAHYKELLAENGPEKHVQDMAAWVLWVQEQVEAKIFPPVAVTIQLPTGVHVHPLTAAGLNHKSEPTKSLQIIESASTGKVLMTAKDRFLVNQKKFKRPTSGCCR